MATIHAPSGFSGEVRKIKGSEILHLAEQVDAEVERDGGFGAILSPCWVSTHEAGPYPFVQVGDTKPGWTRMLKGDVLAIYVELRRISMPDGDNYDFDYHCEECRKRVPWRINLKTDLEVKKLPAESAERVRAQKPFETKLADGRVVRFALATIAQEEPVAKLLKQQKRTASTMVDGLLAQIVAIDGVGPDIKARYRFLSDLDMDELMNLREAFDEPDCGIETRIRVQCQRRGCGWEQDMNLPLGRSFFARPRRSTSAATSESADTEPSPEASGVGSTANGSGDSSTSSSGASTGEAATL